jgi:hypothetical protein
MADDPVENIARAAARRLAPEYGPQLETDVEAALGARGTDRGAEQFDPVSVGILIVAIATLAWMIYMDHREKAPEAAAEVVERTLRTELRRQVDIGQGSDRLSEVIVIEILERVARGPD